MKSYNVPYYPANAEFVERKSRFISHIVQVFSVKEALSFLDEIKTKHREANHNVYAYHVKDGGFCRYSDDGEPLGTAGKPLLEVFNKQNIFDFCCVATRYYGGIPLGKGGLIRAYARCGIIALEASGIGLMCEMTLCKISIPYSMFESVRRFLISYEIFDIQEDFGVNVEVRFSIRSELLHQLQVELCEVTQGAGNIITEGNKLGKMKKETAQN
jgi:uncharacterized YigZ family protein